MYKDQNFGRFMMIIVVVKSSSPLVCGIFVSQMFFPKVLYTHLSKEKDKKILLVCELKPGN